MAGRPQSKEITVRWDESRLRFRVLIPPALGGGRRVQRFFEDEESAQRWISRRNVEVADGVSVSIHAKTGSKTIGAAISAYLKDKLDEVSPEQSKLLRNHLGKFRSRFGGLDINAPLPLDCRAWLKGLPVAQRTKAGIYGSCRTFYRWANRYDYATTNPFERMEPIPKGEAPKSILTVKQVETLLASTLKSYVRSWLILGAFCGLRPIEITRSDWSAVNFETKEIHVSPDAIKRDKLRSRGVRERYVAIPDVAMRLLERGQKGRIVPVSHVTLQAEVAKMAAILKLPAWPHDCLRHSAASYMLAVKSDAGYVAHWLGHTSAKMVHENYARAVPKEAAEKWWSIGLVSDKPA